MDQKLFESLIEINLRQPDDFNVIRETLSRIGIASRKENTLYQTCHIFHKAGRYYIVHFLEMFMIDGKGRHFTDEDKARRNTIAALLEEWDLLDVVNPEVMQEPRAAMKNIRVVPFKAKRDWTFVTKYAIGNKNNTNRSEGYHE